MYEGGGQIFRMSIAFAYILKQDIKISNIRKNRPKGGGLSNQHLTGLRSVSQLVPGCKVTGAELKSKTVEFSPGSKSISRTSYVADCKTPGAVQLILQMTLPCLLFQEKERCSLEIRGGTFVSASPTMFPLREVLLPTLALFGVNASITAEYDGFFPDTVGGITAKIDAITEPLKPVQMVDRGDLKEIRVHVKRTAGISETMYDTVFKPKLIEHLQAMGYEKDLLSFVDD